MAYHNTKQFNHQLYQNINKKNYAEARRMIEIGLNDLQFKFKDRRGFISLVINFNISQNDDSNIDTIIENNSDIIMKRDLLNCAKYYYSKNLQKSVSIFERLIDNFYFDEQSLDFILANKMFIFLNYLDGKYLSTTLPHTPVLDYSKLRIYNFEEEIISKTLFSIQKNINKSIVNCFNEEITRFNPINFVIIDAGNILFSKQGRITIHGYKNLLSLVQQLKSMNKIPLIVIHCRHLKLRFRGKNKNERIINLIHQIKNESEFIMETPYNQNDDHYIIYLSLKYQIPVVTNDNYKDHIFNFKSNVMSNEENAIQNYIDSMLIKYNFSNRNIVIDKIHNYSKCIQVIDNVCFIPYEDDFTQIVLINF